MSPSTCLWRALSAARRLWTLPNASARPPADTADGTVAGLANVPDTQCGRCRRQLLGTKIARYVHVPSELTADGLPVTAPPENGTERSDPSADEPYRIRPPASVMPATELKSTPLELAWKV